TTRRSWTGSTSRRGATGRPASTAAASRARRRSRSFPKRSPRRSEGGGAVRLIDFFDRGVALAPDGPCFSDLQRSRTYREVQAVSHRIAHGLRAAGVRPGDVVATLTPNCLAAFEP